MTFADIIGNENAVQALKGMADSGRVAHSMLFYENDGCGALPLALAYLQYLNCTGEKNGDACGQCQSCKLMAKLIHPDVHFIFPVNSGSKSSLPSKDITSEVYIQYWRELVLDNPYFLENSLSQAIGIEGKNGAIAMAEAKSIVSKLSLTAVSDGYKAVLMYLPEKMNTVAANKLLKMVEEPPQKTIFIFITHAPEKVLQTIVSRCQSLRVLPLEKEEIVIALVKSFSVPEEDAKIATASAFGSIGKALSIIGDKEDYNFNLDLFADFMNALVSKDLMQVLELAENMASLSSREKQKAFCAFMAEGFRKIFLLQQDMPELAAIPLQEKDFYEKMANRCNRKFCSRAISYIEKVVELIDRNVNAKIVFCDLANRLFLTI